MSGKEMQCWIKRACPRLWSKQCCLHRSHHFFIFIIIFCYIMLLLNCLPTYLPSYLLVRYFFPLATSVDAWLISSHGVGAGDMLVAKIQVGTRYITIRYAAHATATKTDGLGIMMNIAVI